MDYCVVKWHAVNEKNMLSGNIVSSVTFYDLDLPKGHVYTYLVVTY